MSTWAHNKVKIWQLSGSFHQVNCQRHLSSLAKNILERRMGESQNSMKLEIMFLVYIKKDIGIVLLFQNTILYLAKYSES